MAIWIPFTENTLSLPCFMATFWASRTINGLELAAFNPEAAIYESIFTSSSCLKMSSSYFPFWSLPFFTIWFASLKFWYVQPSRSKASFKINALMRSSISYGHLTPVFTSFCCWRYDLSGMKPMKWFSSDNRVDPINWSTFIYCSSSSFNFLIKNSWSMNSFKS